MVFLSQDERTRRARRRRNIRAVFTTAAVSLLMIGVPIAYDSSVWFGEWAEDQSIREAYRAGLRENEALRRERAALLENLSAASAEFRKKFVATQTKSRDVYQQWEASRALISANNAYDSAEGRLAALDRHEKERRRGCREAVNNQYGVAALFRATCRGLNMEELVLPEMRSGGRTRNPEESYSVTRRAKELLYAAVKPFGL